MRSWKPLYLLFGFLIMGLISSGCSAGQSELLVTSTYQPPVSTPFSTTPTQPPPTPTPYPYTATPQPPTSTPVLPTQTSVQPTSELAPPMPTPDVILLTIGKENNDWREFTARGFSENRDYSCLVGVDCTTESFPASMCTDRYCQENMDDDTARLVSINFTLDRDYSEVSLRLVRGGRESSLILVDSQRIHLVTFGMLGSNENWEVGEYDLMLGPLTQGDHTIQLFVLDDNRGNGAFGWDSLSIFAWEED